MSDVSLPGDWLERLARVPQSAKPEDLSRFLPPEEGGRPSAVLMLFGVDDDGRPDVLLTQRADTMRSHPGQVSFPGGSLDEVDDGPAACAIREAVEETGLDGDGVDVLGELPALYLPPSGFVVTPVLGWWRVQSPVSAVDPAEVARVVRVPLDELLDPDNRITTRHPSGFVGPAFTVRGLFVWGFTAGLLSRVLALAGLEVPWPTERVADLPPDVLARLQ
ncbi:NUDIX hydrolase [Angustibacter sp. McL0619]|uniref:NUDIX hydrolase n=1 Tax=Angustibacter sp. McL0619 TaxID=3415676 RepID=UPI003CE6FA22